MLPSHPDSGGADLREIEYHFSTFNGFLLFYFAPGSFEGAGVYSSTGGAINTGTLTVTTTPEPGTVFLLALGIGVILIVRLKRIGVSAKAA